MGYLEMVERNHMGYVIYCPDCREYVKQSDPQHFSGGKQVIIDSEPCDKCKAKNEQEILEAQSLMGRLGIPKEKTDGTQS